MALFFSLLQGIGQIFSLIAVLYNICQTFLLWLQISLLLGNKQPVLPYCRAILVMLINICYVIRYFLELRFPVNIYSYLGLSLTLYFLFFIPCSQKYVFVLLANYGTHQTWLRTNILTTVVKNRCTTAMHPTKWQRCKIKSVQWRVLHILTMSKLLKHLVVKSITKLLTPNRIDYQRSHTFNRNKTSISPLSILRGYLYTKLHK